MMKILRWVNSMILLFNISSRENGKSCFLSYELIREEDQRSTWRDWRLLIIGCWTNWVVSTPPSQLLDPTKPENAFLLMCCSKTDWNTPSADRRLSRLLRTRKDWSRLTIKSGENLDSHLAWWTWLQLRRLESSSVSFMMWRVDSKPTGLKRKRLDSSSAESKRRPWDPTRFPSLSLMMEELSDSPTQISRSTILSRYNTI